LAAPASTNRYAGGPTPSGLADVLDLILDKGLVIDLYVRVSVVGIELLTIDARVVVASVDTYLRFAEAVGRLDLTENSEQIWDLGERKRKGITSGVIDGAKESLLGR
jgi:gas vesicle structural protein